VIPSRELSFASNRHCVRRAIALIAILARARDAQAQHPPGVEVRWVAPATCPSTADVEERVSRLLGTNVANGSPTERLVAEATVAVVGGRYRLELAMQREGHPVGVTRVFESDACETLAGAAAVTLALVIRANRSARVSASPLPELSSPIGGDPVDGGTSNSRSASPPTSSHAELPLPEPSSTAHALTETSAPPAVRKSKAHDRFETRTSANDWSLVLQLPILTVDAGDLPSLAYGLGLGAGLRLGRAELLLAGVIHLPQDQVGTSLYADGARYDWRSAVLSSCYGWRFGSFEASPCVAFKVENVTASASGPDITQSQSDVVWLTVGAAGRANWFFRDWGALFIGPNVMLATSRPTFIVDGVGPIYKVPPASLGVDMGCEWSF
jgi:hypothetical protein